MSGLVLVRQKAGCEIQVFRRLDRPLERLRGLLGTGRDAKPVALMDCRSIHTFGMRYSLDIAFLSPVGQVLEVRRGVSAGRLLSNSLAWVTLERPHRCGRWLKAGETVKVTQIEGRR